ncbi:MAG TPA: lysylphosphatidylglycerol synthase domain-containing protein [Candidatus Binatia bacterium]|jgi:uncharacterized membrane protein YbhN (UPF0104 family)|nr:lysylphosphatidylglycerol synthase domain-containing protein [Candidatus Binatia bacterium]
MKRLPFFFLAAGLICLLFLVRRIGLSILLDNLRQISWCILLVIAAEMIGDAVNTYGWRYLFPSKQRAVPFSALYGIRLAGTAVNAVTPTAMVGGEVLKALCLKKYLPLSDGLATVISAKLSLMLGQALFVLVGLFAFFHRLMLPRAVKAAMVAAFLLLVLGSLWFLRMQRNGLFAWLFRLAERFGLPSATLTGLRAKTATIDEKLASLHTTRSSDFAKSVLLHFLAQGLGALQIFLLLLWLAVPADFFTCIAVESFSLLVDGALFFVPGQVGAQEGGKVLIFTAFGFAASTGLTVGIALRLNQLALILLGLAILAALNRRVRREPGGHSRISRLLRPSFNAAADDGSPVRDG